MCVDHGRLDVRVSEQFLHGSNVITPFEQMRCKTVAQRMYCDVLGDTGPRYCALDSALQAFRIEMMAALKARSWIYRQI